MKLFFLLLIFFQVSCSSLSKQLITHGEFSINSGVYGRASWNDSLYFKRISWFHEFTLLFDMNIAKLTKNSKFKNWLSPNEKDEISSCNEFYVALTYSGNDEKISQRMFLEEMNRVGFKKVLINNFRTHLRLHPDFDKYSLDQYKLYGFCYSQEVDLNKIDINLPGFATAELVLNKL